MELARIEGRELCEGHVRGIKIIFPAVGNNGREIGNNEGKCPILCHGNCSKWIPSSNFSNSLARLFCLSLFIFN